MNKRQDVRIRSLDEGLASLKSLPDNQECAEIRRLRDALAVRTQAIHLLVQQQANATDARSGPPLMADNARQTLRTRLLIPISRRAKPLFKHEPAVLSGLRVPPARGTLEEHAAAALAMAKALRPLAKFCREEKFPPNFLADLKAAGTQLRTLAKTSAVARQALTKATRELRDAIRDARALASLIDVELAALAHAKPNLRMDGLSSLKSVVYVWSGAYKLGKPLGRPTKRSKRPPRTGG